MHNFFITGVSILTRFFAVSLLLLAVLVSPRSVQAACLPNTGQATCQYACNFQVNSLAPMLKFCCVDTTECEPYKQHIIDLAQQNQQSNNQAASQCRRLSSSGTISDQLPGVGEVACTVGSANWACPDDAACQALQTNPAAAGYQPIDLCQFANSPECTACKAQNGIWTALGCIPFEGDAFVIALVRLIMGIAGFISLAMMLTGTIIMMTGGGNQEQMKKGREIFTGAGTGLLFLIFSVIILQIISRDIIRLDIGF